MTDEKWLSQVKRGLLELCVLSLLDRESTYGYRIVKRLEAVPGLIITEGTVYPLLSRLKREGLVESSLVESPQGPARRNYVLTPAGRRYVRRINQAWREISAAVSEFISPDEET